MKKTSDPADQLTLNSEASTPGQVWYLVATKPRQEVTANEHLLRQGYSTFLPKLEVKKRRQNRWVAVTEPLFSGYLFLGLTRGEDDFAPIRSTVGCRGLVRFGSQPAVVPLDIVAALLKTLQNSPQAASPFQHGDKVRMAAGPFVGLEAVFDMPRGEERAQVLLNMLGQQQKIIVNTDDMEK